MAFVTSESVSSLAVPMLSSELSLTQTVLQVPSADLAPASGGETIIRVPGVRQGRIQTRGGTLTADPITETPVTFDVDHVYDLADLNPYELTLDIVNFTAQVTRRQVRGVANGAETQLANVMNGLAADDTVAADGSDVDRKIALAGATLDETEVPFENRYLAVSPQMAVILTAPENTNLTNYDGEVASEALRQGIVGMYRGFIVVKSARLTGVKAVAYHESAFAFASQRPAALPGAMDNAVVTEEGIQIRHAFFMDPSTANTRSLLSTFSGAALVDADRVVVLDAAES